MKTSEPASLRTLSTNLEGASIHGEGATLIRGLSDDSRAVEPGDIFCCVTGAKSNGVEHIPQALARGATALLIDSANFRQVPDRNFSVPVILVQDSREGLSYLAGQLFKHLIDQMIFVGVTGTNGKTTTTQMMAAILETDGRSTTRVGTLGIQFGNGTTRPSPNTTPGAIHLLDVIRRAVELGDKHIVMEVSSQAVAQHRCSFLPFRVAAFTNLTPEHFELHGNFDNYRTVKQDFFRTAGHEHRRRENHHLTNLINVDDPEAQNFVDVCEGDVIGYGLESDGRQLRGMHSILRGSPTRTSLDASSMEVSTGQESCKIELKIGGRFNLLNALAAIGMGLELGIDLETCRRGLASVLQVRGRFQCVKGGPRRVVVDYAHSSDGLESLLRSCREIIGSAGQLIVVFGCGGDKDSSKRPRMGSIAARYANRGIITDDNPRSEDPEKIVGMILDGIATKDKSRFTVEHDRREAIRQALELSEPEDLVVIAGKGHETYQIRGSVTTEFDDVQVVKELMGGMEITSTRDS